MKISKNMALLTVILLILCSLAQVIGATSFDSTSKDKGESKWWDDWKRDTNHNKIDDLIEEVSSDEKFGIFINYDRHPEERDIKRLSKFDINVKFVYKYIDVICARDVDLLSAKAISKLPHVVMVKLESKNFPALDISARSIKARESDNFSPNTAFDIDITGEKIRVAILDTGVDDWGRTPSQRHESLDDLDDDPTTSDQKFIAGIDFTQEESIFAPRDGTYNPDDTNGHGSHCAGIAMGTGGTDKNYVGMAPQAELIDVRVMESYGLGNAGEIMAGVEWCISNRNQYNIRVLSMSIGSFTDSDGSDEQGQLINRAVEEGLVVVAGMGNEGEKFTPHWAAADGAIAVGSVDDKETIDRRDDILSDFSNTGPRLDDGDEDKMDELKPDVVAYGDSIDSAQANTASGYISNSGTSMATPHVAGVVALMLHANPALSPEQVKQILRDSAEARGTPSFPSLDPKYNSDYGWGIVDAYKAVELARGFVEVGISIDKPLDNDLVKGITTIKGTAYIISGSGSVSEVEVSIDDPSFQTFTLKAEGTSIWSVDWDTRIWNGVHTIYARAKSGKYIATTSIVVAVKNDAGSNGDGGILQDDDSSKIELPFGIGKVSRLAAATFVGILAAIVTLIIVGIVLRRRKRYKRLMEEIRADQGMR
jgi:serine protease AprX